MLLKFSDYQDVHHVLGWFRYSSLVQVSFILKVMLVLYFLLLLSRTGSKAYDRKDAYVLGAGG